MKHRSLVLACCALLSAQSLRSQTAASDPISGTWTGDIGLDLTTRHAVKFELKLTGASTITGTVTGPGAADFKGGTFDPKTGALKLEVDVKDDGTPRRFVFIGARSLPPNKFKRRQCLIVGVGGWVDQKHDWATVLTRSSVTDRPSRH